jgi:hypothetical protein
MKNAISLLLVITASLVLMQGCYYDSEEYLFPDTGSTCDTVNVTYALSVVPILQDNCLSCHNNSVAVALGGNVKLQDYADVKLKADDGKLVGVISHAPGFVPMPQGAVKMNVCSISIIRLWVEGGAENN